MKLHKISLENLNSLYGQHSIDLSKDLRDAPLFLIMGQTGAGKSTILDAICLALFGETPRLTKQRGSNSTDSRIIMSQGTGECTATVEFSKLTGDGVRRRYRASWTCRRARGKADGKLKPPERSLESLDENGNVLEVLVSSGKQSVTKPVFADILEGMTVSDFKRSMLLAQGQFAAFIKADKEARASILERLTNTEIYRQIGRRAALKMRDAKDVYQRLKAEADAMSLMSAAELEELRKSCLKADKTHQGDKTRTDAARLEEKWFLRRLELKKRQDAADQAHQDTLRTLENHHGDAARLEEDRRCKAAEPSLLEIQRLEPILKELAVQLEQSEKTERASKAGLEEVNKLEDAAQKKKEESVSLLEEMKPALQKARSLRQALRQAKDEKRLAKHAFADAEEKEASSHRGRQDAEEEVRVAISTRDRQQRKWSKVSFAEPLVRELSSLKERHSHLTSFDQRLNRLQKQRDEDQSALQEILEQHANTERELAELQTQLAPLVQARDSAEADLNALLHGALDVQTRRTALSEALERANASAASLERAMRHKVEVEQLSQRTQKDNADIVTMEASLAKLLEEKTGLLEKKAAQDTLEQSHREHLQDLNLAISLSQERAQLKDGKPCPLCGSEDHPYLKEVGVQEQDERLQRRRDDLTAKLEEALEALQKIQTRLSEISQESIRLETSRDNLQTRLEETTLKLSAAETKLLENLQSADMTEEASLDLVRDAHQAATEAQASAQRDRKALNSAESLWSQRDKELRESGSRGERLKGQLESLKNRSNDRKETVDRQKREISTLKDEREEVFGGLVAELRVRQVPIEEEDGTPKLEEALAEATRLVGQYLDSKNALSRAESDLERAHANLEKARVVWMESHNKRTERELALQTRTKRVEELEISVAQDRFAGDPDEAEKEFMSAVHSAEKELMDAQRRAAMFRTELARASAQVQERSQHLKDQRLLTEQHRAELEVHLDALGMIDVDELRHSLLQEHERQEIQTRIQELTHKVQAAQTLLDVARGELDNHDTQRPPNVLLTATRESLQTEREEAERVQEESFRELVQLQTKLEDQERLAVEQEALQEELEKVTKEYELHLELHKLIGVKDGENFKHFAQILNLQELIDKANERLSWLEPRYTLTVATNDNGEPLLDFAVRDSHYAGKERPLTTLSGGETFLVSLAMALSLADYRSVRMPIETLLLDEGLGTLDRETLDVVMNALERLHSRGTQVGIISHIESLKERLQARVVVDKLGGGRSAFRFEFGQTL